MTELPYIVLPHDQPHYETLPDSLEDRRKLPARFHTPYWLDATPGAFICAVCWDAYGYEVTSWPCDTATAHGREVFGDSKQAEKPAVRPAEVHAPVSSPVSEGDEVGETSTEALRALSRVDWPEQERPRPEVLDVSGFRAPRVWQAGDPGPTEDIRAFFDPACSDGLPYLVRFADGWDWCRSLDSESPNATTWEEAITCTVGPLTEVVEQP